MVLKKLKPGMIVYDVKPSTGLQRFNYKWSIWKVVVKEINEEKEEVFASWNGNQPQWYTKRRWSKWRLKTPTA